MMRSLYSGISGLKNHQTRMDVIGNNIANVNTTGYKTSRTIFQDIFSQSAKGGMANTGGVVPVDPTAGGPPFMIQGGAMGGINPVQIGLGIKLSTIDVMHTPAPFQRTDNAFDMMVEGDGFFIVETPTGMLYTRAGNFTLDDLGYLTTSDGYYVMGYVDSLAYQEPVWVDPDLVNDIPGYWINQYAALGNNINYDRLSRIRLRVDNPNWLNEPGPNGVGTYQEEYEMANIQAEKDLIIRDFEATFERQTRFIDLAGFSVGDDGSVSVIINNQKKVIGNIALSVFSNPGGLEKAGGSCYRATSVSGDPINTLPLQNTAGRIIGGGLEMSNVDLATEFTDMIVTQRGFQANSRTITVSDSLLEELVNLKR